jgi:hypothetical protein
MELEYIPEPFGHGALEYATLPGATAFNPQLATLSLGVSRDSTSTRDEFELIQACQQEARQTARGGRRTLIPVSELVEHERRVAGETGGS